MLAASALAALGAQADEATVATATVGSARVVEAVLPGRVLGTAPTTGGRLAILAAPGEDGPRAVFVLDPEAGAIDEAVSGLPPATDALGRLGGEVIAGEPGKVYSLGPDARPGAPGSPPRLILDAVHLHPRPLERRGLIAGGRIFQPLAGRLRIFGPGEGGELELRRELELPVEVRRERAGLRLETPEVSLLHRADAPWPLVLVGPVAHGRLRLLTTVLDPQRGASDASEEDRQRWSQLPAPEWVDESFYLLVDGRPTLAVTAVSAEKIGVFERKKLRVFPLWADRTRAGSPPTLKVETASRRWQEVGVGVVDLDRDGRDDLAVVSRDGLGGKKLVVEVYPGKGNGGFYSASRQTVVAAPEAEWRYGDDVTGDAVPDLVVASGGRLLVFAGVEHKRLTVAKKESWALAPEPPELEGEPRLVDLEGDGTHEILVVSELEGRSVLRLIEL